MNKKEGILSHDPTWQGFNHVFLLHFCILGDFRLSWVCVFKGMSGEPLGVAVAASSLGGDWGRGRNSVVLTGELHYLGIVNNGLGLGWRQMVTSCSLFPPHSGIMRLLGPAAT